MESKQKQKFLSFSKNQILSNMPTQEELALTVQEYPCLWQKGSDDYKDRNMKKNAWNEVAGRLGMESGTAAEVKFKSIREQYCRAWREASTTQSGSAAASSSAKDWKLDAFSFCSYLDGVIKPRKGRINLAKQEELEEEEDDDEDVDLN